MPFSAAPASDHEQAEADEDGLYHAALEFYREFTVRVTAADGMPACCLTMSAMIDRFQNEDAEIREEAVE